MRKQISTFSLMFAMFFLPLGYDALFKFVMNKTGSYWTADLVFYGISGVFWLIYFFTSDGLRNFFRGIKTLIVGS